MRKSKITPDELSEFLINMRTSLYLSKSKFAKLIGITEPTLSSYENKQYFPQDVYEFVFTVKEAVRGEMKRRREEVSA